MLAESRAWQPASAVVLGMVWHEDEDTDTESFQLEATSAPTKSSQTHVSRHPLPGPLHHVVLAQRAGGP